jgi:hypothetical protein
MFFGTSYFSPLDPVLIIFKFSNPPVWDCGSGGGSKCILLRNASK